MIFDIVKMRLMPLKKMSYKTANKIFDLYCNRLLNLDKLARYQKYGYADLNGYDIIDISNAMKLLAANRVFNTYMFNDNKKAELKKYALEDGSGLTSFFFHFFPDDIASKLRRIDPADEKGFIEYAQLTGDTMNVIEYQLLNKEETPDSFLNYCIHIGRTDPNYWGKVYERIGISWETTDDKDPIYILIKNGVNFQPKVEPREVETKLSDEIKPVDTTRNIFKKLKERFFK
jgi:hypothetical protein